MLEKNLSCIFLFLQLIKVISLPSIEILNPRAYSVLHSDTVKIELRYHDFNLGVDGLICVDILWDKGKMQSCYDTLKIVELFNLESDNYAVMASLYSYKTQREVSSSLSSFEIRNTIQPTPNVHITFPRSNEKLTTRHIDANFIIKHFKEEDGYFCADIFPYVDNFPRNLCFSSSRTSLSFDLDYGSYNFTIQAYHPNGNMLPYSHQSSFQIIDLEEEYRSIGWNRNLKRLSAHGHIVQGNVLDECIGEINGVCRIRLKSHPTERKWRNEAIHIMIMSSRSLERYEEAMVMIKSILLHHRGFLLLHFHLILDLPGQAYFEKELVSKNIDCVEISMYDFETTCGRLTDNFLETYDFNLSAHYSGHAGYCRLFIPEIFSHLPISKIIAIESDQIFFDDIENLWKEFDNFNNHECIGMPEMYRGWKEGRFDFSTSNVFHNKEASVDYLNRRYHHNGYIGGIIMFQLDKIREENWVSRWPLLLQQYIAKQENWSPQLNDQDVFNAIFTVDSSFIYVLPCQWNLQYHAFLSHLRLCGNQALNCPHTVKAGIFLCPHTPSVVHYMARSHQTTQPSYYNEFWKAVLTIPMLLIQNTNHQCHSRSKNIRD